MAEPTPAPRYKRVLLKLSGEALMGEGKYGISPPTLTRIASEVKEVIDLGVEVALVIGGGNIFRGVAGSTEGMDRASADYMGMLATCINALAMQDALEKGRVVIFAAGTGNPYFTTDTAASLRAMEINAQVILKATKVDGVYSADPKKEPQARRYRTLTYMDVLQQKLHVMDSTAISLCMDNKLPIVVFDLTTRGNILRSVTCPEEIGTLVGSGETTWA